MFLVGFDVTNVGETYGPQWKNIREVSTAQIYI